MKKHWTQTAEGKARMSSAQKLVWASRKKNETFEVRKARSAEKKMGLTIKAAVHQAKAGRAKIYRTAATEALSSGEVNLLVIALAQELERTARKIRAALMDGGK